MGGLRVDYASLHFSFEPHSPRYCPVLVRRQCDECCAHSGPFVAILGPFLEHIMELDSTKRVVCYEEIKRHVDCSYPFPSFSGCE